MIQEAVKLGVKVGEPRLENINLALLRRNSVGLLFNCNQHGLADISEFCFQGERALSVDILLDCKCLTLAANVQCVSNLLGDF